MPWFLSMQHFFIAFSIPRKRLQDLAFVFLSSGTFTYTGCCCDMWRSSDFFLCCTSNFLPFTQTIPITRQCMSCNKISSFLYLSEQRAISAETCAIVTESTHQELSRSTVPHRQRASLLLIAARVHLSLDVQYS